jgi:hypothetical protein
MIGRLLASLLACAFVAGGAGVGFGEPRPAQGLLPAERLPLGVESPGSSAQFTPVSALMGVGALPSAPQAVSGTSPVSSAGPDVPASASTPARAASPGRADTVKPAGDFSESRSKP